MVFSAVDVSNCGYITGKEVKSLLIEMGNPLAANDAHEAVCDMKGKLPYGGWPAICASRTEKEELEEEMTTASVSFNEFKRWTELRQSRNTVGTYTFFLQTFSLISAKSLEMGYLEVFNFDVGKAAKTCRMPTCGLLCSLSGMAVVPVGASITILAGMWFLATQFGKKEVEGQAEVSGQPMRFHHLYRGLLYVFTFSFAPITRRCISMFVCRKVDIGEESVRLWADDLAVECYTGSHLLACIFAGFILFIFVFLAPCYMVHRVRTSRGVQYQLKVLPETKYNAEHNDDKVKLQVIKQGLLVFQLDNVVPKLYAFNHPETFEPLRYKIEEFNDVPTDMTASWNAHAELCAQYGSETPLRYRINSVDATRILSDLEAAQKMSCLDKYFQAPCHIDKSQDGKQTVSFSALRPECVLSLLFILPFIVAPAMLGLLVGAAYITVLFIVFAIFKSLLACMSEGRCTKPQILPEDPLERTRMLPWNIRDWLKDKTDKVLVGKDKDGQSVVIDTDTIPVLNPQCWDELVKATRPKRYWWFAFIMALKLVVNLIYVFRTVLDYDWEMWLQVVLCFSALLSHFVKPYRPGTGDNNLEQMSLLGLAICIAAAKMNLQSEEGDIEPAAMSLLLLVPAGVTISFFFVKIRTFKLKSAREKRVKDGEKDKGIFWRLLARACKLKSCKLLEAFVLIPVIMSINQNSRWL
eukprot:COSAG05_NODE_496_length_9256_cov_9.286557_6_plen_694_part_00